MIWLAISLCAALCGWTLAKGITRRNAQAVIVNDVRDQGQAVAGYLSSYLLPFLEGAPGAGGVYIAYGIYFLVLWVIYVTSDMSLINPTLYLMGWRVTEVTVLSRRRLLVCRDVPREGESVNVVSYIDVLVTKKRR